MNWKNFSKRLMATMMLKITFECADGHRWIYMDSDYHEACKKAKFGFSCKVYGGLDKALDYVDTMLEAIGHPSLIDTYERHHEAIAGMEDDFEPEFCKPTYSAPKPDRTTNPDLTQTRVVCNNSTGF